MNSGGSAQSLMVRFCEHSGEQAGSAERAIFWPLEKLSTFHERSCTM